MTITINGNGTVTGVSVGGLPDGIVDTDMLAAGAVTSAKKGAGSILQVVTVNKTDKVSKPSISQGSETSAFFTATITPSSSSNKILVIAHANLGCGAANSVAMRIQRDGSTPSAGTLNGDSDGNRRYVASAGYVHDNGAQTNLHYTFLDSPSTTNATVYSIVGLHGSTGSTTITMNGGETDSNETWQHRSTSSITLMEVAV